MTRNFLDFLLPSALIIVLAGILLAQNTTQVELTDAKLAAYYRANWLLSRSTCAETAAIQQANKDRGEWETVIKSTCPVGQSISTANPDEIPHCVSN